MAGSMNRDHGAMYTGMTSSLDNYTVINVSPTILASRLSYHLDLQGPCMLLDTACSSSLVAIHQGCQAIRVGRSSVSVGHPCR